MTSSQGVVRAWLAELSPKMQTAVLLVLRGCDGASKDGGSKWVARCLRDVVLWNADASSTFVGAGGLDQGLVNHLLDDTDSYPLHFYTHLMFAAEIVACGHPDREVRRQWRYLYLRMATGLHLNPEDPAQLCDRLGHKGALPGTDEMWAGINELRYLRTEPC